MQAGKYFHINLLKFSKFHTKHIDVPREKCVNNMIKIMMCLISLSLHKK